MYGANQQQYNQYSTPQQQGYAPQQGYGAPPGQYQQFDNINNANVLPHMTEDEEAPSKEKGSSSACKFAPLLLALVAIAGIVIGVLAVLGEGPFADDDSNSATTGGGSTVRPTSCPNVAPGDRMLMYWQSEIEGCNDIPDGVTHVLWGFAEVESGTSKINSSPTTFQGNDNTLKACIKTLRERCIYSLASIGGANNKELMATINDPSVFANSVFAMVEEFGFDGVDVDDETVGDQFDATRVVNYMKALYNKMKEGSNNYIVTFDGLVYGGLDSYCTDPNNFSFSRCFPVDVAQYCDWVNVLSYNVAEDAAQAATIYENATTNIFPAWITKVGSAAKVNLGTCVNDAGGGGCAFGPGPSNTVIQQWTAYAKNAGGMMIYTGSADIRNSFSQTKLIIEAQK